MSTRFAPDSLPVIDLSPLEAGGDTAPLVAAQIDAAAAEFGFFYLVGHGIAPTTLNSLLEMSRLFFGLGAQIKRQIHMSRGGRAWRGYFPVGGELTSGRPDLKEGLYFGEELGDDDPRVRAGMPLHGRNLFPELPGFREAVLAYTDALTRLGQRLMSLIGLGLGVGEGYFIQHYTAAPTILFRIFNYPGSPGVAPADARGVGEHTDYGLVTLLYQDDVGGLQVKHGTSWIEVPQVPGSFVVNAGDMLERLTSGRYISALHRVINRSHRSRISMPFFFDPGFEAALEPIANVGPPAPRRDLIERWDGIDLGEVRGTYGDYLTRKVSRVFPELSRSHLRGT